MNTTMKDLTRGAKLGLWSTFVFTPCVAIIKTKRLYNTTVDMYRDAYQIAIEGREYDEGDNESTRVGSTREAEAC